MKKCLVLVVAALLLAFTASAQWTRGGQKKEAPKTEKTTQEQPTPSDNSDMSKKATKKKSNPSSKTGKSKKTAKKKSKSSGKTGKSKKTAKKKSNSSGKSSKSEKTVAKALSPLDVTVIVVNKTADKNNRCYVTATIINPNNETITTTVNLTGSNEFKAVSEKITIPAHGTASVKSYFTVKKVVRSGTVTVTESLTQREATKSGIQLIPFD